MHRPKLRLRRSRSLRSRPRFRWLGVREVFAGAQIKDAIARKKWRLVAIGAAVVIGLALLSAYGWRAWYEASVASRSRNAASAKVVPSVTANPTAGAGFPGTPDVVYPAARTGKLPSSHAAADAATTQVADEVIRRKPPAAQPADNSAAGTEAPPAAASNEDIPMVAASGAVPVDLGKVIEAAPAVPKLSIPVSQGTTGGVLLHKVQPAYPAEARRLHMTGSVVMDATVNVEGQVDDLKLVSGDPLLSAAALDAVRKWRYSPYLLERQAHSQADPDHHQLYRTRVNREAWGKSAEVVCLLLGSVGPAPAWHGSPVGRRCSCIPRP